MSAASRPSGPLSQVQAEWSRLERERLEQLASELGTEGLAWLAVAPTWTYGIAKAASFPTRSLGLEQWLERAEEVALVEQEPAPRADSKLGREFWIAESDRSSVLDYLKSPHVLGDSGLRKVTAEVAKRLQSTTDGPELPVALGRWAALASAAEQPAAAAQRLESEVEQLTRDQRLGEARAAVTAGDALARTLGGPHLGSAVDLGNRRLELAYREAGDERHLRRYFKRHHQERAFEALLDGRSPAWALHYMGMGGIGKTMLLRRITSQIAKERRLAISRIDFDQQSPDYPVRKPGNLLLALALELRPHVGTAGERLFRQLTDATRELHEQLGAEPPPDDPLWNVKRPEFDRLLYAFLDLLRSVPDRRIVLLLDTCEELTRVPVVNQILPAVEATFAILERVHDAIPEVRVVLAGRRPLASSGHEWSLKEIDEASTWDRSSGLRPFLPDRPFLALHEILGFTEIEAHDFLTEKWNLRLDRRGALEQAVLERSIEAGRAVAVVKTRNAFTGFDGMPDVDGAGDLLYSPFDLSLYASWLTDDPSLGPDQIRSTDGDPYVEVRIVQRMMPTHLRAALPAIVALGRIDEQTLAEALPGELTPDAVSDLYRALADHEWMEQQRDPQTGQLFLEVEPHLVPRLRKYYAHELRAPAAEAARRRIVPGLERTIRAASLGDLSVHQIDAALGLLPAAAAAGLWTEVLVRVPEEADWNWLRNVTERLLGADGALSRQPALAAGLAAASTSLQIHLAGAMSAPSDVEMVAAVTRWPDEATRPWILRLHRDWAIHSGIPAGRAASMLVELINGFEAVPVAGPGSPHLPARRRSEAEAGSLMYTIEGRADRLSLDAPEADVDWASFADALTAWADVLAAHEYPATLVAMAEIVAARMHVAAGGFDEAGPLVERALDRVDSERPAPDRPWLFWRQPESVIDRVRLEALVLHREHLVGPPPDAGRWLVGSGALSRTESIDAERLASAIEQWQLDRTVPERLELGVAEVADTYSVDRQPSVEVHRRTPPLFVTLAKKRAAIGDYEGADKRLRDRALAAAASRQDAETVRIATIARLEIARAGRVVPTDMRPAVTGLESGLRERSDPMPAFALRALTGVDLTEGFVPTPDVQWATATGGDELFDVALLSVAHDARSVEPVLRAMLRTYATSSVLAPPSCEISGAGPIGRLLAVPGDTGAQTTVSADMPPAERETSQASIDLLATARALADYLALPAGPPRSSAAEPGEAKGPERLLQVLGARRLSVIAQEEGELVAVWLPAAGGRLLELAARLAAYAEDPMGIARARISEGLADARMAAAIARKVPASPRPAIPDVGPAREAWAQATGEALPTPERVAQAWKEHRAIPREQGNSSLTGWRIRLDLLLALGAEAGSAGQIGQANSEWAGQVRDAVGRSPELAFVFAPPAADATEAAMTSASAAPVPVPSAAPRSRVGAVLDQAFAIGAPLVSLAMLLWLVGTGALVFPSSSKVGGEPGWGVVAIVMVGLSLAMWVLYKWRPKVGEVALGSAAFLIGFAIYYAVIGALVDWILPAPLGRWPRFFVVFGLPAGLGFIPTAYQSVWSRWRSRIARRSELAIRIDASAAPNLRVADFTPSSTTVGFDLQRSRTAGWRLPVIDPMRSWSTVVSLPTVVRSSYAEAARAVDQDALRAVADVRADLGDAEWRVPMLIDRADQLPWEGVISFALTASHAPDDSVFLYRAQPSAGMAPPPGQVEKGLVSILGWNPDAVEAWRKAGRTLAVDGPEEAMVVHAVGTPFLGTAGPQFRLAGQHASANAEAILESVVSEAPSDVRSLSELPRPVSLLVLQAEPAFSSGRLGSDREQAALLRAVASDLFHRGHAAVLTIPSLQPELAEVVVQAVARCLSRRPDLWDRLLGPPATAEDEFMRLAHAVREARRSIATWLASHGNAVEGAIDDRVEAAWDVCLFARDSQGPSRARRPEGHDHG